MKFTVTCYSRQLNVLATDEDHALEIAYDVLQMSDAEVFYAEVTDGFTDGVRVINALS